MGFLNFLGGGGSGLITGLANTITGAVQNKQALAWQKEQWKQQMQYGREMWEKQYASILFFYSVKIKFVFYESQKMIAVFFHNDKIFFRKYRIE